MFVFPLARVYDPGTNVVVPGFAKGRIANKSLMRGLVSSSRFDFAFNAMTAIG